MFAEAGFIGWSWGWGWLGVALTLAAIELVTPITYFLWVSVAALLTAVVVFIAPDLGWQVQALIFSVLAVVSIVLSKKYLVPTQTESEQPHLNRRADQYVGRVVTLSEGIEHGEGKVKIDDSHWQVTGRRMPAGSEVRITGAQGAVLMVEAMP